jgi:hypothetical protein
MRVSFAVGEVVNGTVSGVEAVVGVGAGVMQE